MVLLSSVHQHPYYVVTPAYRRESAGVRCLHMLCHALNRAGQIAYVLQDPNPRDLEAMSTGTDLLTPILTEAIARDHVAKGQRPIVVYPETVKGNPFGAQIIVRYVLNFPGLLGGDDEVAHQELRFAYTEVLGQAGGCADNILFIPPIDTTIYKPPPSGSTRNGSCFYADKYRKVHNGALHDTTRDSVEILRGSAQDQTSHEIAALLQTSEVFYTYENTALAIEAVLCGCPAVFLPNPYLTGIIAAAELGPEGYAWGTDPAGIARAKASVAQGAANYLSRIALFERQFEHFVEATQSHASHCHEAPRPLALCRDRHVVVVDEHQSLLATLLLLSLRTLPARLEREIAKFCTTIGFDRVGARLWKNSANRAPVQVVVRRRPNEPAL